MMMKRRNYLKRGMSFICIRVIQAIVKEDVKMMILIPNKKKFNEVIPMLGKKMAD